MNSVLFKAETTFGTEPEPHIVYEDVTVEPVGPWGDMRITGWSGRSHRLGAAELVGHITLICECGGTVDTARAGTPGRTRDGLSWLGVPCDGCERTYTVEGNPDG